MIFKKILDKIKNHSYNKKFFKTWSMKNKNNFTVPGTIFSVDKIESLNRLEIGEKTYGIINFHDLHTSGNILKIGSYCSIGPGVFFMLGAEHNISAISIYPFKVMLYGAKKEGMSKGDIVVGHDVWIGMDSKILSGVRIGQGAIVGAGSVVTKDVEPYSIVGGNPAKYIRYRFPENLRKRLCELNIIELFRSFSEKNMNLVYAPLTEDILEKLLRVKND